MAVNKGLSKPLLMDSVQLTQLEERLTASIKQRLLEEHVVSAVPTPAPTDDPVPPSAEPPFRYGKKGGPRPVPPETITAIIAAREQHPELSQKEFCQHLFDHGIYWRKMTRTGEKGVAYYATVHDLMKRGGWKGVPQTGKGASGKTP
jgi:hypothetical protein